MKINIYLLNSKVDIIYLTISLLPDFFVAIKNAAMNIHLHGALFVLFCSTSVIIREMQIKTTMRGASLVAQWLRVCLLVRGTRVRALVWEDSHMPRSSWAREPQLLSLRVWSLCSATGEAAIEIGRAHV